MGKRVEFCLRNSKLGVRTDCSGAPNVTFQLNFNSLSEPVSKVDDNDDAMSRILARRWTGLGHRYRGIKMQITTNNVEVML